MRRVLHGTVAIYDCYFYSAWGGSCISSSLGIDTCSFGISEYRCSHTFCAHLVYLLKKYTHTSFMTRFLYNQATFLESRLGLNSSTIDQTRWSDLVMIGRSLKWLRPFSPSLCLLMFPKTSLSYPQDNFGIYILDFGLIFSFVRSRLVLIDDCCCWCVLFSRLELFLCFYCGSTTGCNLHSFLTIFCSSFPYNNSIS